MATPPIDSSRIRQLGVNGYRELLRLFCPIIILLGESNTICKNMSHSSSSVSRRTSSNSFAMGLDFFAFIDPAPLSRGAPVLLLLLDARNNQTIE